TSVEEIRKGFINLNNSKYTGKIWIEIFILENINDSDKNFVDIANFLKSENIRYDKIQLNTIDRVGAERDLKAISFEKISRAKKILEENGLNNIEIIKSLGELEEDKKIQVNQELLDNMKQKRLYQEEEINKIFKKN
ncbi:MAG: radical SAM protein, partial [Fusobacterium periodonticum]|nr:radical SAM protein [Fusobacterium periodonticum]